MVGKTESAPKQTTSFGLSSLFWTKQAYQYVADEFHPFHKHDVNVLIHLFTTGLGVWGALQLAMTFEMHRAVLVYMYLIAMTTPMLTAALHTAFVYGCILLPVTSLTVGTYEIEPIYVCLLAIVAGYGLQDVSHILCQEPTYMGSYMGAKPWMLIVHSIWLMPLVIDAVLMRNCFLPHFFVSRNRNFFTEVANRPAIDDLKKWIDDHIPSTPETTHLWPHAQPATDGPTSLLETDAAIMAGFRRVFAAKHFDVLPIQGMNEIYVTAVGAKKDINSDAVFYTPHNDGPYTFLPFCSCYRVLVGLTHNVMVRTRFNLQHETQDRVLDKYGVLGFDYNRELHWIDHVPGAVNTERRSVMKLHYIVYPKGWHAYGKMCANLNTTYNTWARNNFLRTLRPKGAYEYVLAWWIWLTTWVNAVAEEYMGWSNLIYIMAAYAMGPTAFLILTSFRHYVIYMSTFAFRQPPVAHGFFMRDAKLFKTLAMMHLGRRLLPLVEMPRDTVGLIMAMAGFMITTTAVARLGMVRTYFGAELGFVKPQWIEGFPYGTIPHPMIVGQVLAFGSILFWWWDRLNRETVALLVTHMTFYTLHMIQEILTSSY